MVLQSGGVGSNRGGSLRWAYTGPTRGQVQVQQREHPHVSRAHKLLSPEHHHPRRHPKALQRETHPRHRGSEQPPKQRHKNIRGGPQRGCEGPFPVQVQQQHGTLGPCSAVQDQEGGHAVLHRDDDVRGSDEVAADPGGQ